MFADNKNFFYSHRNIKTIFQIVKSELKLVNEWLLANKLSLNAKKTKYVLFHKVTMCDSLKLQLPTDEKLTWKNYIEVAENKISK